MTNQLNEFVNYLKEIRGLSDRSIYHYLTYHRHFTKAKLTQDNINKFVASKKNNSVCRAYIKIWLEFLKKDSLYALPQVKTGAVKRRLIRGVSEVEINKIRDYTYGSKKRDGVIFDLLYFGALRRAEILTIKTNSFAWEKWFNDISQYCEVNVIGKRDKERRVLVHPKAINTILEIYLSRGLITAHMSINDIIEKLNSMNDLLFKKMSEWVVWKLVKKYSTMALKRDIRTHEIRHARATELEESGASIRDIQLYLGHKSLMTTEIYLHSNEDKSLERIKKVSKKKK